VAISRRIGMKCAFKKLNPVLRRNEVSSWCFLGFAATDKIRVNVMRKVFALALSICALLTLGAAEMFRTHSIHPDGCPVQITELKNLDPCHKESECLGIVWNNTSAKSIIACEFRVFCFDALKRLSEFNSAHMFKRVVAPKESHQSPAFMKHRIGSFEAYCICVVPERVIFEDDSIWQRTGDSVYENIVQTIKSDIDPQCLKKTVAELLMTATSNITQ
jgi:hypothetical protein